MRDLRDIFDYWGCEGTVAGKEESEPVLTEKNGIAAMKEAREEGILAFAQWYGIHPVEAKYKLELFNTHQAAIEAEKERGKG